MFERVGQCADCGARFRIPPSFSGTRVKCKKCGGIVEIPVDDAPPPAPELPTSWPEDAANESTIELPAGLEASILSALNGPIARPEPEETLPGPEVAPPAAAELHVEEPAEPEPPAPVEQAEAPVLSEWPSMAYRPEPRRKVEPAPASGPLPRPFRRPAPRPVVKAPEAEEDSRKRRKGHPMLAVALALSVLGIGGAVGFLVMTRDGTRGKAASPFGSTASSAEPLDASSTAGATSTAGEQTGEPGSGERPPTKFVFDTIERAPGSTDDEWRRMESIASQLSSRSERAEAMKALLPFGLEAVPILVHALNGLDLADETAWSDGYEIAAFIQNELTAETILIPYRREFSTDSREIARNQYVLKSIVAYWNTQAKDPVRWTMLLTRYEDKKAGRDRRAEK